MKPGKRAANYSVAPLHVMTAAECEDKYGITMRARYHYQSPAVNP